MRAVASSRCWPSETTSFRRVRGRVRLVEDPALSRARHRGAVLAGDSLSHAILHPMAAVDLASTPARCESHAYLSFSSPSRLAQLLELSPVEPNPPTLQARIDNHRRVDRTVHAQQRRGIAWAFAQFLILRG